ncbi:MAG: hypothetical protein ACE5JZ_06780 [Kiloniellales bacterium]
MKAIWIGIVAAVVLAVVAGVVLTVVQQSSAEKFSTESVRLPG